MVDLNELESYCNAQLGANEFDDYCPNGVQVEAAQQVRRLMVGVTACQALIDAAVEWRADALLVHHGFFWKGEAAPLRGIKGRRIASLIKNNVSLLAYHLPLDAHPEWGNNRQLARVLGLASAQSTPAGRGLVWQAELSRPISGVTLERQIAQALGRTPLHIDAAERMIGRIGWCSGAAQGFIEEVADLGLDAYISGEISESTVHLARERGIHYFAAGHHATERYGVQALGERLAERFELELSFIDIDSPA
ncbi:Nif3-like dinuclear metal center hexameric protein [endosymbiont of Ridgeia piscesae]|jgi:dinuclear metal center YbgI/SA1388 family protein|uniref:GTP cyclohydrolase 1 type 2 homolog n=1 Tax=endosymbiont of Ridgeia piscesae TaxID=54398 RepID=A0A0T5YUL5_9GAMM|nr:Nif3-like dinuclear metal center hexameric protein [endosymbiont of Ridgeia piscesae]KRT54202.1 dinuclear metal center protein, YbgI/SA1388 family [endosymbiont of Ridgeia piscesae]KRT59630.1 dinuclear metal center protein, YbgI/SA1388 family [endosymbiont of Ridgeia piscesae]